MIPTASVKTVALTAAQVDVLRGLLASAGYEFESRPHMVFFARSRHLSVAVYEKGPKAVLQGKGLAEFCELVLEPRVLGARLEETVAVSGVRDESPHFGIDESGKGDLFGPLVVAGVYVDGDLARQLKNAGVQDSKAIGSDRRIRELASAIRKARVPAALVVVAPPRYNDLYAKIGNLNRLLAWGHARVIEDLCGLCPECPRALSDQFADARLLQRSLMEKGRTLQLEQRTKAEADIAVAAASVLAREKFIDWLDEAGRKAGVELPRGVSAQVKAAAARLIALHGRDALGRHAKMHFKTAAEILGSAPDGREASNAVEP